MKSKMLPNYDKDFLFTPSAEDQNFHLESRIWGFRKLGVPYFGVLIIRILLFSVLF